MLPHVNHLVFMCLFFTGIQSMAQNPTVTVRFANPDYDVITQTYQLDVEFQSDTPDKQLMVMNVRFFYDDSVLEFESFGEFVEGYGPIAPNPPAKFTFSADSSYLWGFTGPPENINGGVQRLYTSPVYLSTTGWTKIFNVSFHVDDPTAMNGEFCPSVVWDRNEFPPNLGFIYSSGVVISVTPPEPPISAVANVEQFNWEYDGIPGAPFGSPEPVTCVSQRVSPTTKIRSSFSNGNEYVTFPVLVWNFTDINSFSLTMDYDPLVLEYCCAIPHPAIAANFDTTQFTAGRIQVHSDGFNESLVDESVIFYATFQYLGGSSGLSWYDTGSTCEYVDANTNLPLPDEPSSSYYFDGSVGAGQHVWIGNASSSWDSVANWQGNFIPGPFDNVTISSVPAPAHWPAFTGDFVLGSHCRDLTLNGNAELSVSGDLTINPGHVLTLVNTGEIFVGGDWINSGTFNTGMGSITFNGAGVGTISAGPSPANFAPAYVLSTFTAALTYISGASPGPSGDNAHSDVPIGFTFNYLGVDYSQVRISTNGWLSFNLSGPDSTSHENHRLFTTQEPSTVVAPWWDDLLADGSSTISYKINGTAPNRVFIAEWKNILSYSSISTTRLNFQVMLFETSNEIQFHYGTISAGMQHPDESASIGIKDATGGAGNIKEALQGTSNIMVTCLKSDSDWPSENFRFLPPVLSATATFHHITVSKDSGELRISQNVTITGVN